jgi:hypothetical protein
VMMNVNALKVSEEQIEKWKMTYSDWDSRR